MQGGLLNDVLLNRLYPNADHIVFRERTKDGLVEITLMIRDKKTRVTTHRADVKLTLDDDFSEDHVRSILLRNLKEV